MCFPQGHREDAGSVGCETDINELGVSSKKWSYFLIV